MKIIFYFFHIYFPISIIYFKKKFIYNRAKLLLTGGHNGKSFGYVGVLDFENMTFAEIYRDNSRKEHTAYWFDNNTIVICAEVNYNSLCKDYYLYSLVNSGQPLEGEAQ